MVDKPIRHIDEDGSIYAAEIVPPEGDKYGTKYHVDLVRTSVDDYGLGREQRLTVGQHSSWMEAEEQLYEIEDGLVENGLASLGEDVQRLREQPFSEDVFYLTAVYPPEAEGSQRTTAQLLAVGESSISTATLATGERTDVEAVLERVDVAFAEAEHDAGLALAQQEAALNGTPSATPLFDPGSGRDDGAVRHVDGGSTAHWFAIVEKDDPSDDPYELRYFRALEMNDGFQRRDSYPVMPLPDDDPGSAWPLRGLEMYLEKGDVYMAQQFAHDVADSYGQDFPNPMELPALDPRPEYYFGYGVGPSNSPSLEAVKTWMVGAERRFDTLTINEYDSYEDAAIDEYILDTALATDGMEKAMNIAERWAGDNGYLDPQRADPRIFFEDDAPDDPFTTNRERELSRDVQYHFDYNLFGDDALALEAHKSWHEPDGKLKRDFIVLDLHVGDEGTNVVERFESEVERLTHMQQHDGLEAAMHEAERLAVANDLLDGERADPRLFTNGPPDPFTTLREYELTEPQYSVGAISANGEHFLDVMKTWGENDYERLVIPQPTWEDAHLQAETAFTLQANGDLQGAMHLVEQAGIDAGIIDPERDNPRLFMQGPPDPFTTIRQAELAQETEITLNDDFDTEEFDGDVPGYPALYREFAEEAEREREANAALEGVAWFEATFAKSDTELLQPIDDMVNYAVVVQDADPWTVELAVEKYWKEPNGYIGIDSVTLDTYDPDTGRELAERDREALMEVHDERGLEGLMHKAELIAMENDWLDADRSDLRLFRQGPPDRFETLAQRLEGEVNPYWNTDGDPKPEAENPYWRMETLPVNDLDGESLGHSLHMVVYPQIEHDPERVGTPVMPEDEPFRMLEMAHFETPEAADRFGKEFNGYLMPGLLEGPELAQEVARLEGLPVEWKTLGGDDLTAYQNLALTLTRDPADWHPYNPNAERDARIEAEGLYTDTIHQFTRLHEEDEPKVEPVSPDFDL